MMNRRTSILVALGAWALALLAPVYSARPAGFDPAGLEPYPLPEWYAKGIQTPKYVQDATAWLEKNPTSRYAPRVAMDLLMAGTVGGDTDLADRMRGVLLLDYPDEGPAAYVLSQFKDGAEFAKFLVSLVKAHAERPRHTDFGARLALIAGTGVSKWGPDAVLSVQELALVLVVIGQEVEPRVTERVVQWARKKRADDAELQRLIAVAADPGLGAGEKLVAFSTTQRPAAGTAAGYLMSRLTDAERASPPVVGVMAREAVRTARPSDALKLLEAHPQKDKDPQFLFWRVWAHAAVGERDKAARVAEAARQVAPRDPWTKLCGQWLTHLAALDATLPVHAQALLDGTAELRRGATELEARLAIKPEAGEPVSVYCAYAGSKSFEMHVTRAAQPLVAYRTTPTGASAFSAGDPTIQRFKGPGPLPALRLKLDRKPAGGFSVNFDLALTDDFEAAAAAVRALFASPLLSTREGVLEFMKDHVASGFMPVPPEVKDGNQVFAWLRPQVDEPKLTQFRFVLGPDKRLAGAARAGDGTSFAVESLNYGTAGALAFKPPAWPDLPAEEREKVEMGVLLKMLGVVGSLFAGDFWTRAGVGGAGG